MTNGSLMKVESIAECSTFCDTFDLHKAIIGHENQFSVFSRVAVLHRFYCSLTCFMQKVRILASLYS